MRVYKNKSITIKHVSDAQVKNRAHLTSTFSGNVTLYKRRRQVILRRKRIRRRMFKMTEFSSINKAFKSGLYNSHKISKSSFMEDHA